MRRSTAQKGRGPLKLVEIHREDIETLPALMARCASAYRFLVFCDDLSFDGGDASYKSLKAALEGGVEGRPANVLFYATSNRRHLLPRDMMENERSTAINPGEAVEEKVSLSDRFGLWLGFHKCSQDEYLEMVDAYARISGSTRRAQRSRRGLDWATTAAALRPRCLAVHPGSRGTAGEAARGGGLILVNGAAGAGCDATATGSSVRGRCSSPERVWFNCRLPSYLTLGEA